MSSSKPVCLIYCETVTIIKSSNVTRYHGNKQQTYPLKPEFKGTDNIVTATHVREAGLTLLEPRSEFLTRKSLSSLVLLHTRK